MTWVSITNGIGMNSQPQSSLLASRKFLPYFITQALGAFNDNIYKNVLLLLVAFAAPGAIGVSSDLFINLAAGVFILPFFLFSATAGVLADKYEKSWLIRKVKLAEIAIMACGAMAFITESYLLLLLLLFLMGVQSAFFGPVKYALLPQHLRKDQLVPGNALVETGTFLAILLGTLGAGVIASQPNSTYIAAASVMLFSLLGYTASRFIPHAEAANPELRFRWQPIKQTKQTLKIARKDNVIFQAIFGISWFWFLGACYLTQFPNFAKLHLQGSASAVSFLLALFSVGIAIGSLLCDRLSNHRVEPGIVPLGSIGITIFGANLMLATPTNLATTDTFIAFIDQPALLPVFINLLLLGVSGGIFIVPLYAMMQQRAEVKERAQVIAANNIMNALFMVASAITAIVCLSVLELSIPQFFLVLSALNFLVALYVFTQVPLFALRFFMWVLSHTMYRVTHRQIDNIPEEGGALLVCNHVSYVDALLLSGASPRPIRFVMEEDLANIPLLKYAFKTAQVIPICSTRRSTIRRAFNEVEKALQQGHIVCIFPEGQLTGDGEMGQFMRGMDIILKRSPVPVVPLALKGLWGSYFSREGGKACLKLPKRFWSKIEIVAGEPVPAVEATSGSMYEKVLALRGADK